MRKTAKWMVISLAFALILFMGCERKVVVENSELTDASSCFTCHGDQDARITTQQGQWNNSVHASGAHVNYGNRGGFYDCSRCHVSQGFIDFLETGTMNAPYDYPGAIHCFTCHAPHTSGTLALRTEAPFELLNGDTFNSGEGNLCANCHHSRYDASSITGEVEISAHWGPHHGPQADMINGSNGYEYANYTYEQSPHKTAVDNACVGCHMATAEIFDGYKVGGHSWNMVDEETGSNLVLVCDSCHVGADSYDFTADMDYDHDGDTLGFQSEMLGMLDSLKTLLYNAGVLDDSYEPIDTTVSADVAGAVYNYLIVEEDRSEGVHNFKYESGLILSSIEYMAGVVSATKVRLLASHD